MEIPIVDEQDNIIGYKERSNRNPEDIIRITAIWITDEKGDILLQQRKFNKAHNPGKWSPAASGTVEKGESYDENAYKELQEELGITGVFLTKSKKYYGETNTGKRFVQMYKVEIPHNTQLFFEEEEVEAVRWVTSEELKKWLLEKPEDFVGLMKDLVKLFQHETKN